MVNMERKLNLTIAAVVAGTVLFGVALYNSEKKAAKFECAANGLAVIVDYDFNNTLSAIGKNYCTGNVVAAVDAMYEKYGHILYPGQIIHLP
jgi:hypothetical protein